MREKFCKHPSTNEEHDFIWWHIVATWILKYWSDSEISERFRNVKTIPKVWIDSEICLLIASDYIMQ